MVFYQIYNACSKSKACKSPTGRTKSSKSLIIVVYGYHNLRCKLSSNLFDFVLKIISIHLDFLFGTFVANCVCPTGRTFCYLHVMYIINFFWILTEQLCLAPEDIFHGQTSYNWQIKASKGHFSTKICASIAAS